MFILMTCRPTRKTTKYILGISILPPYKFQGCKRDLKVRDRDETEAFGFQCETRPGPSHNSTRPRRDRDVRFSVPRRDGDRDLFRDLLACAIIRENIYRREAKLAIAASVTLTCVHTSAATRPGELSLAALLACCMTKRGVVGLIHCTASLYHRQRSSAALL